MASPPEPTSPFLTIPRSQECRDADSANDGVITMTGITVGTYELHETKKSSADYQTAPDVAVTVVEGTTTTVKVVNRPKKWVCEHGGWAALGFRNQGQCVRAAVAQ